MIARYPCRLPSVANLREHWSKKAKRTSEHRAAAYIELRVLARSYPLPCVVTLTRIAPRPLDDDNLRGALKATRDGVADWLKVDDRDPRVEWRYGQQRGGKGESAVQIEVEPAHVV